jgi:hypothetical protein
LLAPSNQQDILDQQAVGLDVQNGVALKKNTFAFLDTKRDLLTDL